MSVSAARKDSGAEPGRAIGPDEAPGLWSAVREVACRLGTKPVDAIYLTPGTGIAVTGRRLAIGLGTLPGMTEAQLKAILAHEHCHLSNRDATGGKAALLVRASIDRLAFDLAMRARTRWRSAAWHFVNGFTRPFARIALGASRRREVRADRAAAAAYGARNLSDALRHVARRSLVFDEQVKWEIESALREGRPLSNIYRLQPLPPGDRLERIDALEKELMDRAAGPYDSHPALGERLAILDRLAITENGAVSGDADDTAEALLGRADAFQAEMTAVVEESVRRHHG